MLFRKLYILAGLPLGLTAFYLTACAVNDKCLFEGKDPGCPHANTGGTGGAGGGMNTAGSTNSTGGMNTAGSTSSSTGGAGGQGGQGGTGNTSSTGGSGTGGGMPTCEPGEFGTPTGVTATGTPQTSAYLHDALGDEQYSASTPASLTLTGKTLPAQLVLSGHNGLTVSFTGGDPVEIWSVNLIQDAACDTSGEYFSQACEALVARWFRCIKHPAEESNCADAQDIFASQGLHTTYNQPNAGDYKVVADIRCAPQL